VTLPHELSAVAGAQDLYDWFGYWPAFHDAEIIRLHLNRTGFSSLALRTWQMTKELDGEGYYVLTKHVVVEFILSGVSGVALDGFNHQNVIRALTLERRKEGFRITLEPSYGLAGTIEADTVTLRFTRGKPSESALK
jgi:hypothetical protein